MKQDTAPAEEFYIFFLFMWFAPMMAFAYPNPFLERKRSSLKLVHSRA